jgi:hypothetical protein
MLSAAVNELDVSPVWWCTSTRRANCITIICNCKQFKFRYWKTLYDDKISRSTSKPFSKLYILFHLFSWVFFSNLCLHVISYCANVYRCIIRIMSKGLFKVFLNLLYSAIYLSSSSCSRLSSRIITSMPEIIVNKIFTIVCKQPWSVKVVSCLCTFPHILVS